MDEIERKKIINTIFSNQNRALYMAKKSAQAACKRVFANACADAEKFRNREICLPVGSAEG